MSDIKRELKRCPICGSLPRYWQWNHGAIVECWCKDHRIQCEGKTLEEAIEAWERRTDIPRWTPVTERLPEEHQEVLTSDSVFGITSDSLHNGKWRKHPVAWMPLPEPYKGGEEE